MSKNKINLKYKTKNNEIAYNYEQEGVFALRTANNVYISRVYDGIIEPIMRIKAGTNVELVKALQKGDLDYDTIRKDIVGITSRQWTRQELLRRYSSNFKEGRTTSRDDSLSNSKQKSNIEGNNESSNGNIQHSLTKDLQILSDNNYSIKYVEEIDSEIEEIVNEGIERENSNDISQTTNNEQRENDANIKQIENKTTGREILEQTNGYDSRRNETNRLNQDGKRNLEEQ